MCFQVVGVFQVVVKVGGYEIVEELVQVVVDQVRNGSRGVREAEGYHISPVMAIVGPECCFPFFSFSNSDLVVTPFEGQFRVPHGFGKVGDGLLNEG